MDVTEPTRRYLPTSHRWDIALTPVKVQHWRERAKAAVEQWGLAPGTGDTVAVGVSELLTNVLTHAGDPHCVLELRKVGHAVFVRVTDHCATLPVIKSPDLGATSGRGLWMLQKMVGALCWFAAPRSCEPASKTVWFQVGEIPRAPNSPSRTVSNQSQTTRSGEADGA